MGEECDEERIARPRDVQSTIRGSGSRGSRGARIQSVTHVESAMRIASLFVLLLAPGCILMETGPKGHHNDGCYQDDWGGGGGGSEPGNPGHPDGAAQECAEMERTLEELVASQAEIAESLVGLEATAAEIAAALAEAELAHAEALAAAERERDEALADLAADHYAVLDGLMERITLALAEGRYEDAAADTAVYLAAEEELARQEAEVWAAWEAAVAAADQALADVTARAEAATAELAALEAELLAQADELAADIERLSLKVDECWERLGVPR